MGNDVSRPAGPSSDLAYAPPFTPDATPAKQLHSKPLRPEKEYPKAYGPLTPPPSGRSQPLSNSEDGTCYFRPTTPASPTPSSPVLLSAQLNTPLSPSTALTTYHKPTSKHAIRTSDIPCSKCRRPVTHPLHSTPRPLGCGHLLCRHCIRQSLLAALARDPFTPATCCAPGIPLNTPYPLLYVNNNANANSPSSTTPSLPAETTPTRTQPFPSTSPPPSQEPLFEEEVFIPVATLGTAATPAEFLAYLHKLHELRTPVSQRLYCHNGETCPGMFLSGTRLRARSATCPLCLKRTCRACGGRAHRVGGGRRVGDGKGNDGRKKNRRRKKARRVGLKRKTRVTGRLSSERVSLCQWGEEQ